MGIVVQFPRHATSARSRRAASRRQARSTSKSTVTPFSMAKGNAAKRPQEPGGMLSRLCHLQTVHAVSASACPSSDASATLDGHRSMIERNEAISDMPSVIGRCVLKGKHKSPADSDGTAGHNVLVTRTEIKRGIIQRTREARTRTGLTQEEMAEKLGLGQGTYKNYELSRLIPGDLVPQFCEICEISPADLYPQTKRFRRAG